MIVLCGSCGADLNERACECRRHRVLRRPLTNLEVVVATAAAMGRIDENNMRRAAMALQEEAN